MPNLVVVTGLPCAGKSRFSRTLRDEYNYALLGTDDFRESVYGITSQENGLRFDDFSQRERALFISLAVTRDILLGSGISTVVDSTAYTKQLRDYLLGTRSTAAKYLVWINVPQDVRDRRSLAKGRTLDHSLYLAEHWQDPQERDGVTLLRAADSDDALRQYLCALRDDV